MRNDIVGWSVYLSIAVGCREDMTHPGDMLLRIWKNIMIFLTDSVQLNTCTDTKWSTWRFAARRWKSNQRPEASRMIEKSYSLPIWKPASIISSKGHHQPHKKTRYYSSVQSFTGHTSVCIVVAPVQRCNDLSIGIDACSTFMKLAYHSASYSKMHSCSESWRWLQYALHTGEDICRCGARSIWSDMYTSRHTWS